MAKKKVQKKTKVEKPKKGQVSAQDENPTPPTTPPGGNGGPK